MKSIDHRTRPSLAKMRFGVRTPGLIAAIGLFIVAFFGASGPPPAARNNRYRRRLNVRGSPRSTVSRDDSMAFLNDAPPKGRTKIVIAE